MGSLSIQQLHEMIANTIKVQYEGSSNTSMLYSKPYSKKIDALKMPRGYQPPKFMQFDGKGNPKQHVAHFVETCNNAGTEGDYLAKQFVRSLKGNAFEWYTDLEPESINSWEQLEKEFLNRFYSTCRTVSMLELTSAKQWRDEPVMDYINRWRNLSLDCKDRLSEISSIEMCVQGMQWGLHYILQGIKPRTFEELATRAHDINLSIAHHGKNEPISDFKKDKVFAPKMDNHGKKAFTINTSPVKTPSAPVKISSKTKVKEIKRNEPPRTQDRFKNTLRELEQKTYPFPDSDMAALLDDLLEKKVIELSKCKRPEEMNHVNDPKYCKYHRIVSHPVSKCFILKELIMKLAQQGRIELDLEDTAATHTTTIVFGSFDLVPLQRIHDHSRQCSSHMAPSARPPLGASNQDAPTDDEERWTLVTYKKTGKPIPQATKPKVKQAKKPKVEQGRKHRRRNNRMTKGSAKAAKPTYSGELMEQEPSILVSLHEYFLKDFFRECTTAVCHMVEVEIEGPSKGKAIATEEGETITLEEGLPTHYSAEKALRLPKKMRRALAAVIATPDDHKVQESKAKNASTQHISVSVEQDQKEPKPAPRRSVFNRMNHSRPRNSVLNHIGGQSRTSVFMRLSTPTSQSSVFERLSKPKGQSDTTGSPPRRSAMERLEDSKKSFGRRKTMPNEEKLGSLAEKDDVRSLISSRMKRQTTLEIHTKGPLKVKRRTIVHTGNLHAIKPKRMTLQMRSKTSSPS